MPQTPKPGPTNQTAGKKVAENSFLSTTAIILDKLLLPLFLVYIGVIVLGAVNHESWADEAQSWLLAENLSLFELLKTLPSEGHPPLWYLLLEPFTAIGLPYETVKWLAALLIISAVYLLFFKTSLPAFLKLSVPFSHYMLYEFGLFGRSYVLGAFLAIAIISLYPRRFEKPILFALCIAGLFNTHMLYYSFAMGLVFLYLLDMFQYRRRRKQTWIAFVLMAMAGLYLPFYFANNDIVSYIGDETNGQAANVVLILSGLVPSSDKAETGLIFLVVLLLLSLSRTKPLALLIIGLAGIFYIMIFRYSYIQPRHTGIVLMVILTAICVADNYKDDSMNMKIPDLYRYSYLLLGTMLFLQVHSGLFFYKTDIKRLYSCSKDAADFILDQILKIK